MLGNWSLGDYFKKEQVGWMFEFLIRELHLDPMRVFVTVFRGNEQIARDDETVAYWKEAFASVGIEARDIDHSERDGMQDGRIFYYGEKKNWWSRSGGPEAMPIGEPGGPDTEMFWDFGAERRLHESSIFASDPCHVNCDCGRFMEIGNNVFMQYVKTKAGFELLPKQNVDFGGGLERLAAAVADEPDMFRVDLFERARGVIESATKKTYGNDPTETFSFRVILDHIRAATFLISEGVLPSNKDQGYYVRRLIRRAVRFGNKIGTKDLFCGAVALSYVETYAGVYPGLLSKGDLIAGELEKEELKFKVSLEKGLREFEKAFANNKAVSGIDAFNLYQSYGFPWELTEELAREKGQRIDRDVFQEEFRKHQNLSRAGSGQKFSGGLADHSSEVVRLHTATHLLHQALRTVLGPHVFQRGSNITAERLRFDFSHPEKMTPEQVKQVENLVNENIRKALPVHFEMLDLDVAKKRGAIGVFEEKYLELTGKLKVFFIGDETMGECYSKEVCGGPHVENTSEIHEFHIIKEEPVAAGIRRIKAIISGSTWNP